MNIPAIKPHFPVADPTAPDTAPKTGAAAESPDAKKIADSARQFEAMMVRQVLSETFKPSPTTKGQGMPGSDIYQGFMTDTVADNISQGGSLGISHLLQSQLTPTKAAHAANRHPTL